MSPGGEGPEEGPEEGSRGDWPSSQYGLPQRSYSTVARHDGNGQTMPTFSANVIQQCECHPECPHGSSVGALSCGSTVLLQIPQGKSGCCCCDIAATEGVDNGETAGVRFDLLVGGLVSARAEGGFMITVQCGFLFNHRRRMVGGVQTDHQTQIRVTPVGIAHHLQSPSDDGGSQRHIPWRVQNHC